MSEYVRVIFSLQGEITNSGRKHLRGLQRKWARYIVTVEDLRNPAKISKLKSELVDTAATKDQSNSIFSLNEIGARVDKDGRPTLLVTLSQRLHAQKSFEPQDADLEKMSK